MEKDSPEVRISKTLSWLLRHGAQGEGLPMRPDGYVKVTDLLQHPKLKAQALDLEKIKEMVKNDTKQRYDLVLESPEGAKLLVFSGEDAAASAEVPASAIWWIKARQGHSIKTVQLDLKPINAVSDIPSGMAVHGTTRTAWDMISKGGLSKMKRNHIHLAQNVANQNVVSGMRTSSQVLIFINVRKALDAGIKFWLSDNGVVLTEGDEKGFLPKEFFERVVDVKNGELQGWQHT
ncbi:phosphotransferase KptA/Tpt1 [Agrocybe pediades]|nr:phosphotransferase KptA/Tpt1 [Agrocybe pediades]